MEELGNTAVVEMNAGDVFTIETSVGGGYGSLNVWWEDFLQDTYTTG